MSTKHTLGPWYWQDGAIRASNGDFVLWPQNVMGGYEPKTWAQFLGACGKHSEDDAEANARLIAAAPELLEAVQSLYAFVGVMVGYGASAIIPETIITPLGVPIKIGEIMRDANAAIAKAVQP